MSETLSVFQWSILALAALCIGMSKPVFRECCSSSCPTWQWLSEPRNQLGLVFAEPPDVPGNRNRSLARNPYGKTLPRKSLPKIHPVCHYTFCSNDARIGH